MKREYQKPYLAVESYQLDAAIAVGCDYPINHGESLCGIGEPSEDRFKFEFFNDVNCATNLVGTGPDVGGEDSNNDGVCYHGPYNADGMIFVAS